MSNTPPSNLSQATAAPRTLTLNKQKYEITPLTLGEWGEYEAWLQDRWLESYRRILERDKALTAERKQELLLEAYTTAAAITVGTPAGRAIMASIPGGARLLYYGLRSKYPDFNEDEIARAIYDEGVRKKALAHFNDAQGLPPTEDASDPKGNAG